MNKTPLEQLEEIINEANEKEAEESKVLPFKKKDE